MSLQISEFFPLKEAFIIEIKRRAAYVSSFWLKMVFPPLAQVAVAFFVWDAIYSSKGEAIISGYTFPQMILYYLLASCAYQLARPDMGSILMEIYEGTLTKFLVYPTSFFRFKFSGHVAHMSLVFLELIVGLFAFSLFFDIRQAMLFSFENILGALLALGVAGFLFFIMMACLELLSFWLESAWALCIMLEFVVNLFGGKMLPLDLFPSWLQTLNQYLPFRYAIAFPVEILQGKVTSLEMLFGFGIAGVWCLILTYTAHFIWNRGSYQYSGTGM